ncbi:hypothetical protein FB567DRAFT_620418 [Paraphoma chrysanthemicola]|uniref:Uncharacterized protein n=1 Tax=Paraphoma chrysanthemicola TaxID=798071 RepID=A0A8K0R7C4_9PLEO|nr:hypothetical protein FB567DRAFT_620418 [Paraphoma chrysanthemicola]
MPSKAEKYFDALLGLSGDSLFTQSRQDLLGRIPDDDLEELVKYSFARQFSRRNSEKLVTVLLDIIAGEKDVPREVIKIEDDDSEEIAVQLPDRDSGRSSSTLRTPVPPPQGNAMRSRKRMLNPNVTTGAAKQPKLSANRDLSVVPASHPARTPQVEKQPAPVLTVADSLPSEVDSQQQNRASSSITEAQTPTATPDHQKYVPDIEMMMWVPDDEVLSTWKPMTALPLQLSTHLQNKLDYDYNDTFVHTEWYRRMFRHPERSLQNSYCANYFVYHRTSHKNTWGKASGNKYRACDYCVKSKRLCARLVNIKDANALAIFPLPERFRVDKAWNDVGYWVRE